MELCPTCGQATGAPNETSFYRDVAGMWRWVSKAANGEIYAASHESFATLQGAERNWDRATTKTTT